MLTQINPLAHFIFWLTHFIFLAGIGSDVHVAHGSEGVNLVPVRDNKVISAKEAESSLCSCDNYPILTGGIY